MNHFYTIHSPQLSCTLCDLGASIVQVQVATLQGGWQDVALSPLNFVSGAPDPSLAGRTIGPCCGRLRNATVKIEGTDCQLTYNEGRNHIHGGPDGLAFQNWDLDTFSESSLQFSVDLPDGLDGYPGNRHFSAEYRIDGRSLQVSYSGFSDVPTWMDMTSHVYWDLGGAFDGSALDQVLTLNASHVIYNRKDHCPDFLYPAFSPFNFHIPTSLRSAISQAPDHPQLLLGKGYNNALLLYSGIKNLPDFCARLVSLVTGLEMTMRTDQPAIVLYSGGFLGSQTLLPSGPAVPSAGIALEAQSLPDAQHIEGLDLSSIHRFSPVSTRFQKTISWTFDWFS